MNYSYIIIPIIVVISSQVIKLLTDSIRGNFDLRNLFITYGGMPSSHTAFTLSLATLIGLRIGFDSPLFAVAIIFSLIIINDALAFRNLVGTTSGRKLGHSLPEVLAGALWGIIVTYLLALL